MQLSEKVVDILKKLEGKNIYYALVGVLVLFFLMDYFILMRPQLAALSKIGAEINILSGDLGKVKTDIQRLNAYRNQTAQLRQNIKEENHRANLKDDVPLVLEHISRIAIKNNFQINQIMPDVIQQELLLEDDEKRYFRLPVLIEAKTSYHNFGRFLNQLERADAVLNVDAFAVMAKKDGKLHNIKLTLSVIIFEEI